MRKNSYVINGLKYPRPDKLSSRCTTINRSISNTLAERTKCDIEVEKKWLSFFPEKKCAYCGNIATHLDHLYPLVYEKKPSGFYTEPANLVPCCSNCNSKKRNMNWFEYMNSQSCIHLEGKNKRIQILKEFEKSLPAKRVSINQEILDICDRLSREFAIKLTKAEEDLLSIRKKIYGEDYQSNNKSKDLFEEYIQKRNSSDWINRALTDRSYKKEYENHNGKLYEGKTNEELATYGDSIIKLCFSEVLLDKVDNITIEKQKYESDEFLVDVVAKHYKLLLYIKKDKNNKDLATTYEYCKYQSNNNNRSKYIATAVEAMVGAIYKEEKSLNRIIELIDGWRKLK